MTFHRKAERLLGNTPWPLQKKKNLCRRMFLSNLLFKNSKKTLKFKVVRSQMKPNIIKIGGGYFFGVFSCPATFLVNVTHQSIQTHLICIVGDFFWPPPDDMFFLVGSFFKYVTNIYYRVASSVCVVGIHCAYHSPQQLMSFASLELWDPYGIYLLLYGTNTATSWGNCGSEKCSKVAFNSNIAV